MNLIFKTQNTQKFTNGCWLNDEKVYLWKFEEQLHSLTISNKEIKQIKDVENCTGVSIRGENSIYAFIPYKIVLLISDQVVKIVEFTDQSNKDFYSFCFMYFIGMQKLNNLDKIDPQDDDIFAIVGVYYTAYDQGDQQPCRRYIFYLKGKLLGEDYEVRGNQLIPCPNDNEDIYLAEDQKQKYGFSCIFFNMKSFFVLLV